MKVFETVDDYLPHAKKDNFVAFAGYGIVDGIKSIRSKQDVYKVVDITSEGILKVRAYRGRKNLVLGANSYDQKLALLDEKEYKNLTIY